MSAFADKRDKSVAESTVNLVEQWVIGPANEMTFYTLEEFNEFCAEKVAWLNARPFSAKDGSRDSVFGEEERMHLLPLPPERYEMCEWRSPKVAPDYHVVVDYMRVFHKTKVSDFTNFFFRVSRFSPNRIAA